MNTCSKILELLVAQSELAIILRRRPNELFKLIIKVADVIVAQAHTDFRNGFVRRD